MAKKQNDEQAEPPVAEGTDANLKAAKQGKPRGFLLVCKGTKLLYLSVARKPLKQQALGDAKKLGHQGAGYFGVITGKGMELEFNLSQADGYEAPPVKDKMLKDFLEEHAKFSCKPSIVIRPSLPELEFETEDLNHPLVARFLKLEEQIKKAAAAQPDFEGEIKRRRAEVRNLLLGEEFKEAEPKIEQFSQFLAELLDPQPQAPPPPPPPPPPPASADKPQVDPEMTRFMTRLKDLKPQVEKAVAAKWPAADALRASLGEAADAARQRQFTLGNQRLDELESKLKQASVEAINALAGRLKELRPQIEKAVSGNGPNAAALREQFAKAAEFAKSRDLANANLALDQIARLLASGGGGSEEVESSPTEQTEFAETWASVAEEFKAQRLVLRDWSPLQLKDFEKLVDQATAHAAAGRYREALGVVDAVSPLVEQAQQAKKQADLEVIEEGIVAFRAALLTWNQAVASVTNALRQLQTEMLKRVPAAQDLAAGIEVVLDEFNIGLGEVLKEGMFAKDATTKRELYDKALALIAKFQTNTSKNVLVSQLDRCTFAQVNLRQIMNDALAELTEQLAS